MIGVALCNSLAADLEYLPRLERRASRWSHRYSHLGSLIVQYVNASSVELNADVKYNYSAQMLFITSSWWEKCPCYVSIRVTDFYSQTPCRHISTEALLICACDPSMCHICISLSLKHRRTLGQGKIQTPHTGKHAASRGLTPNPPGQFK
jgi:hypothetical protein